MTLFNFLSTALLIILSTIGISILIFTLIILIVKMYKTIKKEMDK